MDEDPSNKPNGLSQLRSGKMMKKRLRKIESNTLKHAHKFVVKRWENVREVRRHALAWLLLLGILISSLALQTSLMQTTYQKPVAATSGTYSEGVLGQLNNLNPIYAISHPERSASRLMFASLLTYDEKGSLRNDLASSWKVEEQGRRYSFKLRKGAEWSDGKSVTAKDVVFTIESIKNVDARSPLNKSWRDILVSSTDDETVVFDLPVAYGPFPHFLTVGILPAHAFEGIEASELRRASFNRNPITSGPFTFRNLQIINIEKGRSVVHMVANERYYGSKPKLDRFQMHVYSDRSDLSRAFTGGEVSAVANFTAQDVAQLDTTKSFTVTDVPINNIAFGIFKTDSEYLSDEKVRNALVLATDRKKLIDDALYGRAVETSIPIPASMYQGGDAKQSAYDVKKAEELLDQAGWVKDEKGKRSKDGQPLRLAVATIKTGDYPRVLESLSSQWSKVGITVDAVLANPDDVQQSVLAPRAYDVLIYELAIGGDPDVYPYWHSSQAHMNGLNLANYKSAKADDALSSARTRFELDLRSAKYKTFVEQWLADAPAVVLYQPTLHYVSKSQINIDHTTPLVDTVDRYRNVQYWSLGLEQQNQTR